MSQALPPMPLALPPLPPELLILVLLGSKALASIFQHLLTTASTQPISVLLPGPRLLSTLLQRETTDINH